MNGLTAKSRAPAFLCMIVFLLCEIISLPYAEMGVSDDWSYIQTAQLLAQTGHIHYNGWATAILGWQLYPAAAFIKLFGFSYTISRVTCILVGALTVFLIQRTFVRAGINQRNAALGTLAIALSPLYMQLSATFMSDVPGLFAVVVCFYGCLRALQAAHSRKTGLWICFAALTNAVFGTSRQIAWLGALVIVPCTLWLVRHRREAFVFGSAAMLIGWTFIAFCLHWFKQQPYAVPESLLFQGRRSAYQIGIMIWSLVSAILEIPLLILPIVAAYLVLFPNNARRFWKEVVIGGLGYVAILITARARYGRFLEPRLEGWVSDTGGYHLVSFPGTPPTIVLSAPARILLTVITLLSTFCVIALVWRVRKRIVDGNIAEMQKAGLNQISLSVSSRQLLMLVVPFTVAYFVLLAPSASGGLFDRYLLTLTFVVGLWLVRTFQDFVNPSLPGMTPALVVIIATYSIGVTHDMFAIQRARKQAAVEIWAAGLPRSVLDGGFEYDHWVEITQYGHINRDNFTNPPNTFILVGDYGGWSCDGDGKTLALPTGMLTEIPHFSPQYGLSFDPNRCAGPAGFPPVRYVRWVWFGTGNLYIVKYQPRKASGSVTSGDPPSER